MLPDLDAILRSSKESEFKSQGERRIAEFLDRCGVRYMYEAPVVVRHRGHERLWYPDFFLPDLGLYVEYYGIQRDPNYEQGVHEKQSAYEQAGIAVIGVYPYHLSNGLQQYLSEQIQRISQARLQTASNMIAADPRHPGYYTLASGRS